MAITPTTPITVTETRKVEETVEKTYDSLGVESINFRWVDNNASGKIAAFARLRPFAAATGELAPPEGSKTISVPDLMALAAEDPEVAEAITKLFAVIGKLAVAKGIA